MSDPVTLPSPATVASMTRASLSSPAFSDVRSVESRSGSMGKIAAAVYTEVVFARACPSMAEPFLTSASTSATATRMRTAPPGPESETVSWSRSRESSLSIEHQRRWRRSRTAGPSSRAGPVKAPVSALAAGEKSASSPRSSMTRRAIAWRRPRLDRSDIRLLDQAVEIPCVLADDLVGHVRRQMAELLLDVLGGLGPHAVAVWIVGAPHERLHADVVDELGADAVELEGGLALPTPVVAGLHLEPEIVEAVLPLEVHPVESVGQPADAALSEGDADVGIALEHGAADHGGQDVDEVHLEAGHGGEERSALGVADGLVPHAGRHRREGVEVQRQADLVHRLPERLPDRMPHRLHVP